MAGRKNKYVFFELVFSDEVSQFQIIIKIIRMISVFVDILEDLVRNANNSRYNIGNLLLDVIRKVLFMIIKGLVDFPERDITPAIDEVNQLDVPL